MAEMNDSSDAFEKDSMASGKPVRWIVGVLLLWVTVLAIRSWFIASNSVLRSALIVAPAIGFVLLWGWLLRSKSRR